MKRSKWKIIPNFNDNLRDRIITPNMINKQYNIHMGNKYKLVTIKSNQVGYKLGDFAHSKHSAIYKSK